MENDYIKRRQTEQRYCFDCKGLDGPNQCEYFNRGCRSMAVLEGIPAADVVEARHGHWKILRPRSLRLDRRDSLFECSECGANRIRRTGEILNYCPNCGARMDGEEQEHE